MIAAGRGGWRTVLVRTWGALGQDRAAFCRMAALRPPEFGRMNPMVRSSWISEGWAGLVVLALFAVLPCAACGTSQTQTAAVGSACSSSVPCDTNLACFEGFCFAETTTPCTTNAQCAKCQQACDTATGFCIEGGLVCASNADCPCGLTCAFGACVERD
jgi:hypothetical protein